MIAHTRGGKGRALLAYGLLKCLYRRSALFCRLDKLLLSGQLSLWRRSAPLSTIIDRDGNYRLRLPDYILTIGLTRLLRQPRDLVHLYQFDSTRRLLDLRQKDLLRLELQFLLVHCCQLCYYVSLRIGAHE